MIRQPLWFGACAEHFNAWPGGGANMLDDFSEGITSYFPGLSPHACIARSRARYFLFGFAVEGYSSLFKKTDPFREEIQHANPGIGKCPNGIKLLR